MLRPRRLHLAANHNRSPISPDRGDETPTGLVLRSVDDVAGVEGGGGVCGLCLAEQDFVCHVKRLLNWLYRNCRRRLPSFETKFAQSRETQHPPDSHRLSGLVSPPFGGQRCPPNRGHRHRTIFDLRRSPTLRAARPDKHPNEPVQRVNFRSFPRCSVSTHHQEIGVASWPSGDMTVPEAEVHRRTQRHGR